MATLTMTLEMQLMYCLLHNWPTKNWGTLEMEGSTLQQAKACIPQKDESFKNNRHFHQHILDNCRNIFFFLQQAKKPFQYWNHAPMKANYEWNFKKLQKKVTSSKNLKENQIVTIVYKDFTKLLMYIYNLENKNQVELLIHSITSIWNSKNSPWKYWKNIWRSVYGCNMNQLLVDLKTVSFSPKQQEIQLVASPFVDRA